MPSTVAVDEDRLARAGVRVSARPSLARREATIGLGLVLPSAVILLLFFIAPLALTVVMSVFDWPLFGARRFVGGANYAEALGAEEFWAAARFTAAYTVVSSVLGVAISLALALLLRPAFPGRGVVRTVVFAPVTIGMASAGLLCLTLVNPQTGFVLRFASRLGWADPAVNWLGQPLSAYVVLIVLTLWKTVGFAMLVLIIGMNSVPTDVYEAARIDGANAWQTLFLITLPLIRQPLALVVLLTTVSNFLGFDQFYTLTKGGPDGATVSLVFYLFQQGFRAFREGYASAVALIIALLMLGLSVLQVRLQRRAG